MKLPTGVFVVANVAAEVALEIAPVFIPNAARRRPDGVCGGWLSLGLVCVLVAPPPFIVLVLSKQGFVMEPVLEEINAGSGTRISVELYSTNGIPLLFESSPFSTAKAF